MSDEKRVLTPDQMSVIGNRLRLSRTNLGGQFSTVIEETEKFAESLVNAVGDISVEEAKKGLVDYFADRISRIRV